jgi:hypothetical protein
MLFYLFILLASDVLFLIGLTLVDKYRQPSSSSFPSPSKNLYMDSQVILTPRQFLKNVEKEEKQQ